MPTPSSVDLNSRDSIRTLDQSNLLGSVESLALQIKHAWEETQSIVFTPTQPIQNIVIAGMGGSGLGADVIKSVFKSELSVPLDIVHDYTLPGYVNANTLVILSSYSGTTEEVLAVGQSAQEKGAQIMAICAGGKLAELARTNHWPYYLINPTYNPSQQPRMAIGYSVFGIIALCVKAGVLHLATAEIEKVVTVLGEVVSHCTVEIAGDKNPAKLLAYQMFDKRTLYIGADFLEGALHTATNQSNENAKTLTGYYVVPEMNHHLLESLRFPTSLKETTLSVFFSSDLNQPANIKRVMLTKEIFDEHGLETMVVNLTGPTKLAQAFELINTMSFVSLYQVMLEGIDPSPIPAVESFKQKMKL